MDFVDSVALFDGRLIHTVPSPRHGEERWISVGKIDGRLVAVVWVRRDAESAR